MSDQTTYHALIVDDTIDLALMAQAGLEMAGISSHCVSSGMAALAELEKGFPDLMILDIGMPGMTGWQVLDTIKERFPEAQFPVIIMTAFGDPANKLIGKLQARVVRYITKPFELADLMQAAREALRLS